MVTALLYPGIKYKHQLEHLFLTVLPSVCDELPLPASGTIEYTSNRSIGSTASYLNFQCNLGFEQRGEMVHRCSENGWEGQTPYCSKLSLLEIY